MPRVRAPGSGTAAEGRGASQDIRGLGQYSARIGQTIQFFFAAPTCEYRHIVLDQLRDMGGTRFFVSINSQSIALKPVSETPAIEVRETIAESIKTQTIVKEELEIDFVRFEDLRILSGENMMVNLPPKWQRFALIDPDTSPVVVVQLRLNTDEWAYLATQFPNGESLTDSNG